MIGIELVLLSIIALFFVFLGLRQIAGFKICALCASVSLTWIALLVFWFAGFGVNRIALAVLMGGSLVGAMYLLEEKMPEKFHLFKLPYIATGIALIYGILERRITLPETAIVLGLWAIFAAAFLLRHQPGLERKVKKIIECCKNW